jgi:hypothetical protein
MPGAYSCTYILHTASVYCINTYYLLHTCAYLPTVAVLYVYSLVRRHRPPSHGETLLWLWSWFPGWLAVAGCGSATLNEEAAILNEWRCQIVLAEAPIWAVIWSHPA